MKYGNIEVTLDNYREVFSGYTIDILDEIRSALLDSTPVLPYLDRDPRDLHQIRLAMLEAVPPQYFVLPADTLILVRAALRVGSSLTTFDKWFTKGLDSRVLEAILDWEYQGYNLSSCDFKYLNPDHIDLYSSALSRSVDISRFLVPLSDASTERVSLLLSLNDPRFLDSEYSTDTLRALLTNPCLLSISNLNPRMSSEVLDAAVPIVQNRWIDLYPLLSIDPEGYFLYNETQVSRVIDAFNDKLDCSSLLDPSLSPAQLNTLITEARLEVKNSFKGKLSNLR